MFPRSTTNQQFELANKRAAQIIGANPDAYRLSHLLRSRYVAREVAHPRVVRHFKGFLDVPTRIVDDEGKLRKEAIVRRNLLSSEYHNRFERWNRPENSCFDVVTGFLMHRHKTALDAAASPSDADLKLLVDELAKNGAWRNELQALTEALLLNESKPRTVSPSGFPARIQPVSSLRMLELVHRMLGEERQSKDDDKRSTLGRRDRARDPTFTVVRCQPRPRTSRTMQCSPPPPSRCGSARIHGRRSNEADTTVSYYEQVVFNLLGQILQTDEPNIIRSWLLTADERQKSFVFQILNSAMPAVRQYAQQLADSELTLDTATDFDHSTMATAEKMAVSRNDSDWHMAVSQTPTSRSSNTVKVFRECAIQTEEAAVKNTPNHQVELTSASEHVNTKNDAETSITSHRAKTAQVPSVNAADVTRVRARTATAQIPHSTSVVLNPSHSSESFNYQGGADILKIHNDPRPRSARRPMTAQNINLKLFALGQPTVTNLQLNVVENQRPSTSYRMRYMKSAETRNSISRQLQDAAVSQ